MNSNCVMSSWRYWFIGMIFYKGDEFICVDVDARLGCPVGYYTTTDMHPIWPWYSVGHYQWIFVFLIVTRVQTKMNWFCFYQNSNFTELNDYCSFLFVFKWFKCHTNLKLAMFSVSLLTLYQHQSEKGEEKKTQKTIHRLGTHHHVSLIMISKLFSIECTVFCNFWFVKILRNDRLSREKRENPEILGSLEQASSRSRCPYSAAFAGPSSVVSRT